MMGKEGRLLFPVAFVESTAHVTPTERPTDRPTDQVIETFRSSSHLRLDTEEGAREEDFGNSQLGLENLAAITFDTY